MTSKRIHLPEPVNHCTLRILYGDTDAGGVVYNANYLRYFEFGRSEYMRQYVMSYKLIEERGFVLPVVESFVRYKAPAAYDDLIRISTSLVEVKKRVCRFNHRIYKDNDDTLLVKGYTVHVTVDKSMKMNVLDDDIMSKLKSVVDCQQE